MIAQTMNNNPKQRQNKTAFFGSDQIIYQINSSRSVSDIPQLSVQSSPAQQSSMAMPQPLIIKKNTSPNPINEFQSSHKQEVRSDGKQKTKDDKKLQLTFYPQLKEIHKRKSKASGIAKLKKEQQYLRKEIEGINKMMDELLVERSEQVNEYEQVLVKNRYYKSIMKTLAEQYEGYCTMLQANYFMKLEQQYESQAQRHSQLKKEVHDLNNELSKPQIKDIYEHDQKADRLEKQFYQLQITVEKQKANNVKKEEKLEELKEKINQKKIMYKRIVNKIAKCEQQCDDDVVLPAKTQKALKKQYQNLSTKLNRLRKIKEQLQKRKQSEYYEKIKQMNELQVNVKNIIFDIQQIQSRSQVQQFELKKAEKKKKKHTQKMLTQQTKEEVKSRNLTLATNDHSQHLKTIETRGRLVPRSSSGKHDKIVINDKKKSSLGGQTKHFRSVTEGSQSNRLQLNLRRKKIYTELEKNMYFQNIQNHQIERRSRVFQGSDRQMQSIPLKSVQGEDQKILIKLPGIQRQNPPLDTQHLQQSIINQAKILNLEQSERFKALSIQKHNQKMKKVRANRQKWSSSNYHQLCSVLKRDKLLIEDNCEYEMEDLIYNSKF